MLDDVLHYPMPVHVQRTIGLKSLTLSPHQLCDLELLMNGGFYPLQGFLCERDYESVLQNMRLGNGALWPIPITLDVSLSFAEGLTLGEDIVLVTSQGVPLAILHIQDIWQADKNREAALVYQTEDLKHPGVYRLMHGVHSVYIGGRLENIQLPVHYNFKDYRKTPKQLKALFHQLQWTKIIGFQTRNPMHRAHYELTLNAAQQYDAHVLIHPVVGMTKPKDIDYVVRMRCYEKIMSYYPAHTAYLSTLPLAMRMAGPREALWHALIRKNYGCTHFIVGRDHAGPGNNSQGRAFYDPYAAQELCKQYRDDLGIDIVALSEMVYIKNSACYKFVPEILPEDEPMNISGSELRGYLQEGQEIPSWFSFPEVIEELKRYHPPKHEQGFTLFFTGLSGSGKSTLAEAVMARLLELGKKQITLLDGDELRKHLNSDLGFSAKDRDLNILRMSFVAHEINKHRGIAICAPIAPYEETRQKARALISQHGCFIEIYLNTPLAICEARDRKGLYAKARAGLLPEFTGIDAPYEPPSKPELMINTETCSIDEAVDIIMETLYQKRYLCPELH